MYFRFPFSILMLKLISFVFLCTRVHVYLYVKQNVSVFYYCYNNSGCLKSCVFTCAFIFIYFLYTSTFKWKYATYEHVYLFMLCLFIKIIHVIKNKHFSWNILFVVYQHTTQSISHLNTIHFTYCGHRHNNKC